MVHYTIQVIHYMLSTRSTHVLILIFVTTIILYELGKEPTKYDCVNFDCLFLHLSSSQPIQPEPMYPEIALELILRVLLAIAQQVSTFTQFIKATLLSTFDMLTDIFM